MKPFIFSLLIFPFLINAGKPVSIFNGNDLTGWTIHGTEKWYVENGQLIC
jgi:hypothetical protein